jgi:hypothetical protein
VIEGWHPSRPDRLGYNLMFDGDWIGTFESLDAAAEEATRRVQPGATQVKGRRVVLVPHIKPESS